MEVKFKVFLLLLFSVVAVMVFFFKNAQVELSVLLPLPGFDSEGEPMALSVDYWEQTGNALQNLFNLQCWAGTVNISNVVEPSIKPWSGVFQIMFKGNSYTFQDMFDISHWNQMSLIYGAAPLVSFDHFVKHASRNIVFVQVSYAQYEKSAHCNSLAVVAKYDWARFLRSKKFKFIKNVCLNFKINASFTQESFREVILGGTNHQVTVLFDKFKGIHERGNGARMVVSGPMCNIDVGSKMRNFDGGTKPAQLQYVPQNSSARLVPSKRILNYVNRFILEHLSGERYIAVMLRTERLKSVIGSTPDNDTCATAIISDWHEMVNRHNISKTLLFSDIGSHGSHAWAENPVATTFSNYVHDSINLTMSLEQINSVLENMTESKDSMQIAVLHRQLMTHATCVLVVGGGIFQDQALNMYLHNHKDHECYSFRTGHCLPFYISKVYGL